MLAMTVEEFPDVGAGDAPAPEGGSAAAREQAEQVPVRVAARVHA
ncbi:MAG: hypothetical protein PWQ41_1126 [Bacillota bacterium]|nr:hypothetical protein [Bacillota bacterium]MDK2855451.1 hypothetical protein [Bacillota bacterium]MDK2925352.1 hypothetical protein [Bacillota bacterium]